MGKRLYRIDEPAIKAKIGSLLNIDLDIILKSGAVHHCSILSVNNDDVLIKDKVLNKQKLSLNTITEIIYSKESAY